MIEYLEYLNRIANITKLDTIPDGVDVRKNGLKNLEGKVTEAALNSLLMSEIGQSIFRSITKCWSSKADRIYIKPQDSKYFDDIDIVINPYLKDIDFTSYISIIANSLCCGEMASTSEHFKSYKEGIMGQTQIPHYTGTYRDVDIYVDPYMKYNDIALYLQKNKMNVEYYYNYANYELTYYINIVNFNEDDIDVVDFITNEFKYNKYLARIREDKLSKI